MYTNTTPIIVTFKSGEVIFRCLDNLQKFEKVLILDNSKDTVTKKNVEKKYQNVCFFNSKYNLGYSRGHNYLMRKTRTEYALLISPDVFINEVQFKKIENAIKELNNDFAILAPYDQNYKGENYGIISNSFQNISKDIYEVDYVNGFFMFMNLKKIFKAGLFDKNFFLYNEDIDLCKRIKNSKEKIYILKNLKTQHLSSASSNIGLEYDKCKNWHWLWSKFYLEKKNNGYFFALIKYFPIVLKLLVKSVYYFFVSKKHFLTSFMRLKGLVASMLGKKSFYRPNIIDN